MSTSNVQEFEGVVDADKLLGYLREQFIEGQLPVNNPAPGADEPPLGGISGVPTHVACLRHFAQDEDGLVCDERIVVLSDASGHAALRANSTVFAHQQIDRDDAVLVLAASLLAQAEVVTDGSSLTKISPPPAGVEIMLVARPGRHAGGNDEGPVVANVRYRFNPDGWALYDDAGEPSPAGIPTSQFVSQLQRDIGKFLDDTGLARASTMRMSLSPGFTSPREVEPGPGGMV